MQQVYDMTVYNYLKDNVKVIYRTVRDDETQIRCPYCGDSQKDARSAHLYIKNQAPFPYYCQRCSSAGVVTSDFLLKIDAYDGDMAKYLKVAQDSYNKDLLIKYGTTASGFAKKKLILAPNKYEASEMDKLAYIEDRIGKINYFQTAEDLHKFNIILNLEDFLINNKFDMNSYSVQQRSKVNDLDRDYAMFLLNDRIMVNGRNIRPGIDKKNRFYKFRILDDVQASSTRFYNINEPIDMQNRVFNIHMTEGIFDLLTLYANGLIDTTNENKNNVYVANNGKGYLFVLEHLQKLGILNCNINIYSDSDVSIKELKRRLHRSLLAKFNGVTVYYNLYHDIDANIKDFGVPVDKIKMSRGIPVDF